MSEIESKQSAPEELPPNHPQNKSELTKALQEAVKAQVFLYLLEKQNRAKKQ